MNNIIISCIISAIISAIISVILSDKIIQGINIIFMKLGLSPNGNISGVWEAHFEIEKTEYIEIIRLKNRLGIIWGRIEPHELNYSELQSYMNQKPLRIKGSLTDNRFFTGYWYHPIENYRFHGSFQLSIEGSMKKMNGQWIGYSISEKEIINGKWTWKKIED